MDKMRQIKNILKALPVTLSQWQEYAVQHRLMQSGRGKRVNYTQALINELLPVRRWRLLYFDLLNP